MDRRGPAGPGPRLGDGLTNHDNALNFLRLVLAAAVIVGHTPPLGGFDLPQLDVFAGVAVEGFFVLSGFLIAGSRVRMRFAPFLWRRVLRIMPGFWVCLVVVALGFAPLAALLAGQPFSVGAAWSYVWRNCMLVMRQYNVGGQLGDLPYPGVWNGSLWTLSYEFQAYLAVGAVLSLAVARRHCAAVMAGLTVLGGLLAVAVFGFGRFEGAFDPDKVRLLTFFVAGATLYFLRDRLPAHRMVALAAAVSAVALHVLSYAAYLALGPFLGGYTLLWLGGSLPVRWGSRNDLSYGVYIYAFPVQQALALAGGHRLTAVGFMLVATLVTLALAAASWYVVEKPAMRLRRLVPERPRGSVVQPHHLHDPARREAIPEPGH